MIRTDGSPRARTLAALEALPDRRPLGREVREGNPWAIRWLERFGDRALTDGITRALMAGPDVSGNRHRLQSLATGEKLASGGRQQGGGGIVAHGRRIA